MLLGRSVTKHVVVVVAAAAAVPAVAVAAVGEGFLFVCFSSLLYVPDSCQCCPHGELLVTILVCLHDR